MTKVRGARNMTVNVTAKQVFQGLQFVLLLVITGLLLWSQPWNAAGGAEKRTISVTGEATTEEAPDEYTFSPYFEAKGMDKTALKETLTIQANDAVAKLKELGVAESDMKLDLSSFDQWYWLEGEEGVATAYIQIKISDKDLAQKVQDYLLSTDAKGQQTPQASFSKDKQKSLEDSLTNEAILDARRKAEQQAAQLGAKLGDATKIQESADVVFPMAYDAGVATLEASADSARSSSLPVLVGEDEYTKTVSVTFELK